MAIAATISPDMAKRQQAKSVPVQGRLTPEEVEQLDNAALRQSVPVDRATMVAFILRKWLREQGESKRGVK